MPNKPFNTAPNETAPNDRGLTVRGLLAWYRGLYRPAETSGRSPRAPHPGDIAYWVTCLGAACLLLLAAT
jgi:hypothetical protein